MPSSNKANVDNSTTIRAASKKKKRNQPSNKASANLFDSSSGGSLASSLSSLFSPQPHGKDAALASMLASSSKPPVNLSQKSGLAAFGSFPDSKSAKQPAPTSKSLDDKLEHRRKDAPAASSSSTALDTTASKASISKNGVGSSSPEETQQKQKQATENAAPTPVPSKPFVPNVPAGRKPVFRPVLASSTAVSWPEMPVAGSKTVLHTLLKILADPPVKEAIHRDLGQRKPIGKDKQQGKDMDAMEIDEESSAGLSLLPPQVLAGVNSVTRAVEADIAKDIEHLQNSDSTSTKEKSKITTEAEAPPSVKIVFVCRHDVASPSLISHLPMLITSRNAVSHACGSSLDVLLFSLPSGSESLLASALSLRRASILAITSAFSPIHMTQLLTAIERETGSVCHLRATWLETALLATKRARSGTTGLHVAQEPTTIKLLRTTQPVDLNVCKAAKKSKRKERSAKWKKKKMAMRQKVKTLKAEVKHAQKVEKREKAAKSKAEGSRPNPSSTRCD